MDIGEFSDLLRRGYGGRQLTALYTNRIDVLLRDIFSAEASSSGLCLIAVGGYGRAELAPFSDIDIMLFAKDRSSSEQGEAILYRFWNTGLEIGHSFRTPADCIREARKDIRTRTSLIEHRYIAGDTGLYRSFLDDVYPEIAFRDTRGFISEKLRELEARHRRFGDSVFLLEPHIKEGKGCLRDIHALLWLGRAKMRIKDFDGLQKVLSPEKFARLSRSYDFLLKTRFCLHLLSGRRNDVLSFGFHEPMSRALGFKASQRFLSSERFMRYLYLKASAVHDVVASALDVLGVPYGTSGSRQYSLEWPLFFARKKIAGDFSLVKNRIVVRKNLFSEDPERMVEAFHIRSKTGKQFSPGLIEDMRKNILRITRDVRASQRANDWFMKVISGKRVYRTLREMHDYGVLGRFIPEFGALTSLVVYEPYHRYTVDQHTLYAIRKIEELYDTTYKNLEHLSVLYRGMKHREILILSLLLHDIGKRRITRDMRFPATGSHKMYHEGQGYVEMKAIMERFNLSVEMRNRTEFLVRNHTLMSHMAFKRETDDPDVVAQFADEVTDRENLDALYLMTYADMAAVSVDFWSDWKGYLLRELYEVTVRYMEGFTGEGAEEVNGMLMITDKERQDVKRFLSPLPLRYRMSTPPHKMYADYLLYLKVQGSNCAVNVHETSGGTAEITVTAWDRPGLFSSIVGVLSSLGMSIYSARLYTGENGLVIDRVQISNWRDLWWEGMVNSLETKLTAAVGSEETESTLAMKRVPSAERTDTAPFPGRFVPFVELDNETSRTSSLIEFFAQDRLGLLYDATNLLHEKGIDIISARINTEGGLAHDIFYVQLNGNKLSGPDVTDLLHSLWERLH